MKNFKERIGIAASKLDNLSSKDLFELSVGVTIPILFPAQKIEIIPPSFSLAKSDFLAFDKAIRGNIALACIS